MEHHRQNDSPKFHENFFSGNAQSISKSFIEVSLLMKILAG